MKNIITAMGNPQLNEELIKTNQYCIMTPDIQYQDGVIEILNEKKEAEILIVSETLTGENNVVDFITEIKKINNKLEIIVFLENETEEIKNRLIEKGVFRIFSNNKISFAEIINLIDNKKINIEKEIAEEINNLKKIILENNMQVKTKKQKIKNIIRKIFQTKKNNTNLKNNKIINSKIICITGLKNSGKTMVSFLLSKYLSEKENKILMLDFDILKNEMSLMLGIKKRKGNIFYDTKNQLQKFILKINKKIDFISAKNIISVKSTDSHKIKTILSNLKELNRYHYIIIDTAEEHLEYLMKYSDICIHVLEANILEIKKSREMLFTQINNFYIAKEKIKLIFNKYNIYSINEKILSCIYSEFKILGKIKYHEKYNFMINKNKFYLENKEIKKEYEKIIKNIIGKENKLKKYFLSKKGGKKLYGNKSFRTSV